MANIISAGIGTDNALFPEILVKDIFNAVRGKSALAKLSQQRPVAFVGNTEFVFNLDGEADIVAENGAKSNGGATFEPVHIIPVKFEYGTRVSDEFIYASEEQRMETLRAFTEGAARKFARALDIGAIHGLNPRTGNASSVIGTNNFNDRATPGTISVDTIGDAAEGLESLIANVQARGFDVTGMALSPLLTQALSGMTETGIRPYPEFSFGAQPDTFYGMNVAVNSMVTGDPAAPVYALVGDFNAFRWGYAKDVNFEVIRYGNPDNNETLGDLRGHNQVYLRCEAYIGWGILAPYAFSIGKAGGGE